MCLNKENIFFDNFSYNIVELSDNFTFETQCCKENQTIERQTNSISKSYLE